MGARRIRTGGGRLVVEGGVLCRISLLNEAREDGRLDSQRDTGEPAGPIFLPIRCWKDRRFDCEDIRVVKTLFSFSGERPARVIRSESFHSDTVPLVSSNWHLESSPPSPPVSE